MTMNRRLRASLAAVAVAGVALALAAPAAKTLVVDLVAPAVPTVSAPPAVTKSGIAPTFTDSAGDLAGYECSVDGDVFAGCVSGATITVTGDGRHDLAVRAVDNVGNV